MSTVLWNTPFALLAISAAVVPLVVAMVKENHERTSRLAARAVPRAMVPASAAAQTTLSPVTVRLARQRERAAGGAW